MKIISVISQKGGVGKSTLTFNLAVNVKDYSKTCIIDFDAQGSLLNIASLTSVPIFPKNKLDEIINSDYDYIFIDTPPYVSEELNHICEISDLIIVPTKAGILDLFSIRPTIEIISAAGKSEKAIIVFNMVKSQTSLTEEIKSELKNIEIPVSKNLISDLVAYTRSVAYNGVEESNKAQKQMDNLTKEILTLSSK